MEILFLILFFVALVPVALLLRQALGPACEVGTRRFGTLEEAATALSAATGLEERARADPRPLGGRLAGISLSGNLPYGRSVSVTFHDRLSGKVPIPHARLAVAADDAPFITVTEETWLTKFGEWLGVSSHNFRAEDRSFDERFHVETGDHPRARYALAHGLRPLVERAFTQFHVMNLSLGGGVLAAEVPARRLEVEGYRPLLELLVRAAETFDRKPIHVRVLGGERRALCVKGGKTRCSYCHEHVAGDEPDLVACEKCATVLHGDCWTDLGRCPILGCTGRAPERARTAER
ncbi:hypothetical protein HY251_11610 [bacterium]|nr:hypothetical protein [bacterium]